MKRIYTRVRNETFERKIAWYTAGNFHQAADAIRALASDTGVPLDEAAIQELIALYRKHFA